MDITKIKEMAIASLFGKKEGVVVYMVGKGACIIEVENTPRGHKVVRYGEVAFPRPKPGESLTEIEEKKVVALKDLVQESGITKKEIVTSLPGREVMVRYFQVPPMPKKELETAVKFEARRHIPYKLDELIYDFHILKKKPGEKKLKVLFVGTRMEVLKNHLSLLTRSGLEPVVVDINANALVRVLGELTDIHSASASIILSVNPEMADITIVKDGIIHLSQDISSLVVRASNIKESLLGEVRLFLNFCKRELGLETVDKTFLLGDRDFFEGWDDFLSQELKIPVEIVNPPISGMFTEMTSWGMLMASGLAIRNVVISGTRLNIGKSILAIREKLSLIKKVVLGEAIASVLLLNVLFWPTYGGLRESKKQLDEKKRRALELNMETKNVYELQELTRNYGFEKNFIRAFVGNKGFWPEKLTVLANNWPRNAWLTELAFTNSIRSRDEHDRLRVQLIRELSVTGSMFPTQTEEIKLINNLVNQLKTDARFASTEVKSVSLNVGDGSATISVDIYGYKG